jgi:hypothetical protein
VRIDRRRDAVPHAEKSVENKAPREEHYKKTEAGREETVCRGGVSDTCSRAMGSEQFRGKDGIGDHMAGVDYLFESQFK